GSGGEADPAGEGARPIPGERAAAWGAAATLGLQAGPRPAAVAGMTHGALPELCRAAVRSRRPPSTSVRLGHVLPARDRGDHVDARARVDGRPQPGALAVDVDVDVHPQLRPGLAEPVAKARPALLQPLDGL